MCVKFSAAPKGKVLSPKGHFLLVRQTITLDLSYLMSGEFARETNRQQTFSRHESRWVHVLVCLYLWGPLRRWEEFEDLLEIGLLLSELRGIVFLCWVTESPHRLCVLFSLQNTPHIAWNTLTSSMEGSKQIHCRWWTELHTKQQLWKTTFTLQARSRLVVSVNRSDPNPPSSQEAGELQRDELHPGIDLSEAHAVLNFCPKVISFCYSERVILLMVKWPIPAASQTQKKCWMWGKVFSLLWWEAVCVKETESSRKIFSVRCLLGAPQQPCSSILLLHLIHKPSLWSSFIQKVYDTKKWIWKTKREK